MKYAEFRALENGARGHKADDLLAAAISAFTMTPRPSGQEKQQFNDLVIPLLSQASVRARRHAAAVLSESDLAPKELIFALANDLVEIAAPILLRSPLLEPTDLIELIDSRGLGHARVIARREDDDADLLARLHSFDDEIIDGSLADRWQNQPAAPTPDQARPSGIERTRETLRELMTGRREPGEDASPMLANKLIDAALLDDGAFFQTALADALGIGFDRCGTIVGKMLRADFIVALRSLGIGPSDAHLIISARFGPVFASRSSLKGFITEYRALTIEAATANMETLKTEDISQALRRRLREVSERAGHAEATGKKEA